MYEKLPKQYWAIQDYLLYAYDVLGDMLRQADSKDLSSFTIQYKEDSEHDSLEKAEDIFEWLDNNGYHEKAVDFFTAHVFFLLLKDFCYYMYESISCAERGKVTVSYSLLRKPLRDNLLYLEWLLSDKEEFYETFLYGSIEDYDISNYKIFNRNRISSIIKKASTFSYMGDALNYDDIVYKFRFSGKDEIGLQRIWNQSMHLVTTSPNYKTEKNNLNFIFADEQLWSEYWDYYYHVVPQLMAYVLEICEALFLSIVKVDSFNLFMNRNIRFIKYANVYPFFGSFNELNQVTKLLYSTIEDSNSGIKIICENCSSDITLTTNVLNQMINGYWLCCSSCNREQNICKYYTDYFQLDF
ncbi:hypothetical protein BKP35_17395 [Anaerobacillus arseniciselenatis]|uniref:Uncharacterized protein n=1 Tax=Anaerobacillus arseniciselenatis TaxID=85682 RepID=A0A1S2L8L8_9BACI|nr:hypothetical protein [Anaerobacillus arseniciselenatis]OIJ08859.1 hypothetical protein BKP35_17395 [Anaerobacillus arseniciselenatis]